MGLTGFKARVLTFARVIRNAAQITDVAVDPGGGPTVTLEAFGPPGDDSPPLATDFAFGVPVRGRGRAVAVGFADPLNEGQAAGGERRFIGRSPVGVEVCSIWLKGDGTVVVENGVATVRLNPTGSISLANGSGSVSIGPSGGIALTNDGGDFALSPAGALTANVTTLEISNGLGTMSLDAAGAWTINGATIDLTGDVVTALLRSLNLHTHAQANDSAGDVQQPTGPAL